MNKTHTTIWNNARQAFVVAGETARTRGAPLKSAKTLIAGTLAVAMAAPAMAYDTVYLSSGSLTTSDKIVTVSNGESQTVGTLQVSGYSEINVTPYASIESIISNGVIGGSIFNQGLIYSLASSGDTDFLLENPGTIGALSIANTINQGTVLNGVKYGNTNLVGSIGNLTLSQANVAISNTNGTINAIAATNSQVELSNAAISTLGNVNLASSTATISNHGAAGDLTQTASTTTLTNSAGATVGNVSSTGGQLTITNEATATAGSVTVTDGAAMVSNSGTMGDVSFTNASIASGNTDSADITNTSGATMGNVSVASSTGLVIENAGATGDIALTDSTVHLINSGTTGAVTATNLTGGVNMEDNSLGDIDNRAAGQIDSLTINNSTSMVVANAGTIDDVALTSSTATISNTGTLGDLTQTSSTTTLTNSAGATVGDVSSTGGLLTLTNAATATAGSVTVADGKAVISNSGTLGDVSFTNATFGSSELADLSNAAGATVGNISVASSSDIVVENAGTAGDVTFTASTAQLINTGIAGNITLDQATGSDGWGDRSTAEVSNAEGATIGNLVVTNSTDVLVNNEGTMGDATISGGSEVALVNYGTAGDVSASETYALVGNAGTMGDVTVSDSSAYVANIGAMGGLTVTNSALQLQNSGTMGDVTVSGLAATQNVASNIINNQATGTIGNISVSDSTSVAIANAGTVGTVSVAGSTGTNIGNSGTMGAVSVTGTGSATLTNSGSISSTATLGEGGTVYSAAISDASGSSLTSITLQGDDAVINGDVDAAAAAVSVSQGADFVTSNAFNVASVSVAHGATMNISSTESQTGSIADGITVSSGFTNSGTVRVDAGSTGTINGDYTQTASGVLQIGVEDQTGGAATYGKLAVTGTATLDEGTTINVDVTNTQATFANTDALTDVISAGTLNASTINVTDNSYLFNFTAVVDGNTVDLNLTQANNVSVVGSVSENKKQASAGAANVLDLAVSRYAANGTTGNTDYDTVIASLGSLTTSGAVSTAASQLTPSVVAAQPAATFSALGSVNQVVNAHVDGRRGLAGGDAVANQGAWTKVFGTKTNQKEVNGAAGYDATTYGVVVGTDADIVGTKLNAGVAFAYNRTKIDSNDSTAPADATVDSYQGIVYGTANLSETAYVDGQADIGLQQTNTNRYITFSGLNRVAKGDYSGQSYHVGGAFGMKFDVGNDLVYSPSIGLDYTRITREGYTETGADSVNLVVQKQSAEQGLLSFTQKLTYKLDDASSLFGKLTVAYDALGKKNSLLAAYAGDTSSVFTTDDVDNGKVLGGVSLGYSAKVNKQTTLSVQYDYSQRKQLSANSLQARLNYAF